MPAAQKSSTTKKAGAPKAKGAVRAKSGCYTCRIRRKKCDEQPNVDGHCQTCVRLRLQCLGFGAKRPEWLRENRNVVELRDKIKTFLAAQGMIKGHSGSGPRSADNEPTLLRLADDYSSSSESPPTPTISLSSAEGHGPHHMISSIRDQTWMPAIETYSHSGLHSLSPHPRDDSNYGSPRSLNQETVLYPNTLVQFPSRALNSTFSPLYCTFQDDSYEPVGIYAGENHNIDAMYTMPSVYVDPWLDQCVKHYMENVIAIQYLLADKQAVSQMIFRTVNTHEFSREAVGLLVSVHLNRETKPDQVALMNEETASRLEKLLRLTQRLRRPTVDDAMAALHVVSSFLFDGGCGSWSTWLDIASQFVDNTLDDRSFYGPADVLEHCDEKIAFVIKTTIWFDVLASVTTQLPPRHLRQIRLMFSPCRSNIEDPTTRSNHYSMMDPMGCENHVVWALAETSNLSWWKEDAASQGSLSIPDLVARGAEIEKVLEYRASAEPLEEHFPNEVAYCRFLASEIFRASTRLYLRSVVSGDHPSVPEIREGVVETLDRIQLIPNHSVSRSVIRSTVFGIFICGCLADERTHRDIILNQLVCQTSNRVGNCHSIKGLLDSIWAERRKGPKGSPVQWRQELKSSQTLLV